MAAQREEERQQRYIDWFEIGGEWEGGRVNVVGDSRG